MITRAALIAEFAAGQGHGAISVTRTAAGSRTKGLYTPGSTSTFSIVACTQPTDGDAVRDLPEAQDADEIREIWTVTELAGRTAGTEPDLVDLDGDDIIWQVIKVAKYDGFDEVHYVVHLAKVNPGTPAEPEEPEEPEEP